MWSVSHSGRQSVPRQLPSYISSAICDGGPPVRAQLFDDKGNEIGVLG